MWLARAGILALLLTAIACDEHPDSRATSASSALPTPSSRAPEKPRLPASVAAAKKLRVGSDVSYPPLEYYADASKVASGFDVDLCNAMAKKVGPDFACEFVNDDFDQLLDDLGVGKFDIVMSAMTDKGPRQAKADFIDYFRTGMSVLVNKGNPLHLTAVEDLCGKSLGAQRGTDEEVFANQLWTTCNSTGKPLLTVVSVRTDDESLSRLKAHTIAADLADYPAADYTVKNAGGGNDFEMLGPTTEPRLYGVAVGKNNVGLRDVLIDALKAAFADGSYAAALTKWKLGEGQVKVVELNGG